jgi:2-succinyl-6-hydroxy-2,4-cyclohexadiene-1-carboxylate synthase
MAGPLHRVVDRPAEGAPRLVLVHGFTQTMESWGPPVGLLTDAFETVRVDLPGHGGSSDVRLGFVETAAAIGDAGGTATYVGYSLGGRLCLRLALDRPDLVEALVLVGASPGLADRAEREARRRADEALADEIERTGTAVFLARWLAQPLFASFTPVAADLEARLANRPAGLAAALRSLGTGAQEPLRSRLAELSMPVLAVAGQDDERYARLAEEMAAAIGANAEVVAIAGAGHAAHLEQPEAFARAVAGFLVRHPPTP